MRFLLFLIITISSLIAVTIQDGVDLGDKIAANIEHMTSGDAEQPLTTSTVYASDKRLTQYTTMRSHPEADSGDVNTQPDHLFHPNLLSQDELNIVVRFVFDRIVEEIPRSCVTTSEQLTIRNHHAHSETLLNFEKLRYWVDYASTFCAEMNGIDVLQLRHLKKAYAHLNSQSI